MKNLDIYTAGPDRLLRPTEKPEEICTSCGDTTDRPGKCCSWCDEVDQ